MKNTKITVEFLRSDQTVGEGHFWNFRVTKTEKVSDTTKRKFYHAKVKNATRNTSLENLFKELLDLLEDKTGEEQ